jgi:predicted transcriptional regulator of viral defense system
MIGGWSAAEHHGLTDQTFRDVVVFASHHVRDRHPRIQDTTFRVVVVHESRLFGTDIVWRDRVRVQVSDPSRTVVDILGDPNLGGGIRHVADIVSAYFVHPRRDDARLLDYARRLANRTVYKRLGYLVELMDVNAPEVIEACLERKSRGFSLLDPTMPPSGRCIRRWNLLLNARIEPNWTVTPRLTGESAGILYRRPAVDWPAIAPISVPMAEFGVGPRPVEWEHHP